MSWRLILAVLLLAIGASIWGGITMGNWLIEHGPLRDPIMTEIIEPVMMPTLDADGKPFTAEPPQPLVNGRLGVPEPYDAIAWQIDNQAADKDNPPIALATTRITMAEAQAVAAQSSGGLQGIASVGNLGLSGGANEVQPVDISAPPPPPAQEVASATDPNWRGDMQRELHACSQRGFFDRPSCSWDVRNKYCGPNNAWGKVAGCPSKSF
ncbi:hypothetical protein L1889_16260 [Paenalcaligenes niemegkensis]|uniref:hypothetical protein n=1 Tax=Paenalcaligenes niemegkensis TaxID=2895469 RepID=UPI001EE8F0F2|nr:hypothetical protein [Paenalcaligenes niemegkensis]MCQ9618029.1 hypothetical protein [Paenalcaligenes niemegkensis]